MQAKIPDDVADFMKAHKIGADEIWQVHGSAWVIKHKALERVAADLKITFDQPHIIESNGADGIVSMIVTGNLGDRSEWSIGEASPKNNKNSYPYAMSEKRAKDRVILKLLKSHGSLYSEEEADDFKSAGNGKMAQLPKKDAKEVYTKLQREISEAPSREQLKAWGQANADRIAVLPDDWADILRLRYEETMADLRNREAA